MTILLTGCQLRAARAMLRWSVQEARRRTSVGEATIRRLETAYGVPHNTTTDVLERLRTAFEAEGITFTPENGARGPGVSYDRYPGRVVPARRPKPPG
jgi:hypothetical protein